MGFIVKGVKSVVKAVVGIVTKVVGGVVGLLLGGKKKAPIAQSSNSRLNKSLNPEDFRKIIFGKTASALDIRYWEVYGVDANTYDEVIAVACHRINSYKELYIENDLAINAANVVQSKFAGVLNRVYKLGVPGQTALSVGGGGQWTSAATFDGVAHMVLKWTKNDEKLPNGPPSRYTNIIEGALVYDPRRDSTVIGGSGSHRANDQSTWDYATLDSNGVPLGRNNALQALWYLLGWRVANPVTGEIVLIAGRGIEPEDINMQTFMAGANDCEVAGYYTDLILSTEDEHTSNEDKITADGVIATLLDPGGLWSYFANVDDTATIAVEFTDDDILDSGKVSWNEYKGMADQYNQVIGKFIDPSTTALFQPRAYPIVRDVVYENNLGVKRRKTIDFEQIQDSLLAQKLARLVLNQGQFQAEFAANFNYRALKAQAWSVVRYTSARFQWTKLFRIVRYSLSTSGGIGLTLREIHPSIWTPGTATLPVTAPLGTRYDPTVGIALTGMTHVNYSGTGDDGTIQDGITLTWSTTNTHVKRTEIEYRLDGDLYWQSAGFFKDGSGTKNVFPLASASLYNFRARYVNDEEVPGDWYTFNHVTGSTSNVGRAAIDNIPLGSNLVINSDYIASLNGHYEGWNGNSGLPVTRGLNVYAGYYGQINVTSARVVGNPAGGTVFDAYATANAVSLATLKRHAVPVTPGDRIYYSMLVAGHRCGAYVTLQMRDGNGAYATEAGSSHSIDAALGGPAFDNGDPANAFRSGAFITIPNGVRYVYLESRALVTGGPSPAWDQPVLFAAQPFIAKVAAGQTLPPPYSSGPPDRAADATGENTANNTNNVGSKTSAQLLTDLTNAQTDATNAATNAANAIGKINIITNDGYLDKSEKPLVMKEGDAIYNEYPVIDARAFLYGISTERTTYYNAYAALMSYLAGLSPAWNDPSQDTGIVRSTFNGKWNDYYYARQLVLDKLAEIAKTRADLGVNNAALAQYDATAAGTVAGYAQTDATSALGKITNIVSDSILDKSEKPTVNAEWQAIYNEVPIIYARANALGATTEASNLATAQNNLSTYLSSLSPAWYDANYDTSIVRSTFNAKFTDYYYYRQVALDAIAYQAALRASWGGIPGGGGQPTGGDVAGTIRPGGTVDNDNVDTDALQANAAYSESNFFSTDYVPYQGVPGAWAPDAMADNTDYVIVSGTFNKSRTDSSLSITAGATIFADNRIGVQQFIQIQQPGSGWINLIGNAAYPFYMVGATPYSSTWPEQQLGSKLSDWATYTLAPAFIDIQKTVVLQGGTYPAGTYNVRFIIRHSIGTSGVVSNHVIQPGAIVKIVEFKKQV